MYVSIHKHTFQLSQKISISINTLWWKHLFSAQSTRSPASSLASSSSLCWATWPTSRYSLTTKGKDKDKVLREIQHWQHKQERMFPGSQSWGRWDGGGGPRFHCLQVTRFVKGVEFWHVKHCTSMKSSFHNWFCSAMRLPPCPSPSSGPSSSSSCSLPWDWTGLRQSNIVICAHGSVVIILSWL